MFYHPKGGEKSFDIVEVHFSKSAEDSLFFSDDIGLISMNINA